MGTKKVLKISFQSFEDNTHSECTYLPKMPLALQCEVTANTSSAVYP